ncbi:tetratricopeptide repeat protein, partial [Neptunomonas marina]
YIYNTLGVLYLYKQQFKKAEESFLKATENAPQWAVPWNNLIAVYTAQKKYANANDAYVKAIERNPQQADIYANAGIMYEQQKNDLFAEEMQRKSIFLNSRHFFPFEKLANIYTRTTAYALADSLYYEADLRKKGFHFSTMHSS